MSKIGLCTRKLALSVAVLAAILLPTLYTAPAQAQNFHSWVSHNGLDSNLCTQTSPCQTFQGALAKVSHIGVPEISCLDSGSFGQFSVTFSVIIDCAGVLATTNSDNATACTNGIDINGPGIVVTLRNLDVTAFSPCNTNGISIEAAAQVIVENCKISNWPQAGINAALMNTVGLLQVHNTTFVNNTIALSAGASGGGLAIVQVYNSTFVGTNNTGNAIQVGIIAGRSTNVTVGNSNFQDLNVGAQVDAGALLEVDTSLFFTSTGIKTNPGTNAYANNNSFYGNGPAFDGTGTVNTANNNKIGANATVGSATINPSGIIVK